MTAFNVVRYRVKPDREAEFLNIHRQIGTDFKGFKRGALVKTGERTYCFVGEWTNFGRIVAARPRMVSLLDQFRDYLEDLGGGLGVTDPVSGSAVALLAPKKPRRAGKKAKAKKSAAKKPAKKKSKKRAKR